MVSRRMASVWVFVLVTAWAGPAWADWLGDFFVSVGRDTARRNCWPEPFIYSDRQATREAFAAEVANGWQRQNVIMDMHFDNGGTQLSEYGRRKVLDILNQAPEQHRAVFVFRGATPQETAVRMATVQQFIAQSAYNGQVAPVYESNRPDDGSPADRIDLVNRKLWASIPDPKLPAESGGGGGSSSSGSSGH